MVMIRSRRKQQLLLRLSAAATAAAAATGATNQHHHSSTSGSCGNRTSTMRGRDADTCWWWRLFWLVLTTQVFGNSNNSSLNVVSGRLLTTADLPTSSSDQAQWVSLQPGIEFMPAITRTTESNQNPHHHHKYDDWQRMIDQSQREFFQQQQQQQSPYGRPFSPRRQRQVEEVVTSKEEVDEEEINAMYNSQPFVEGVSDYDEYQQAWRLLGFMIDCDATGDDDADSHDNKNNNNGGQRVDGCSRFLIWAAYVDLDYEGGGIGEYSYWDSDRKAWDKTACDYTGTSRCAKMDCHLDTTHWSLLGFFKHRNYDDWMEQLFKHEGYCIWHNGEYGFMNSARKSWPQGCTLSATVAGENADVAIYYDVKPVHGGGITVGLYTDAQCIVEYKAKSKDDPVTVENVVGNFLASNNNNNNKNNNNKNDDYVVYDTLEENLAAWDAAFARFTICQPCLAHDLLNYGYNGGNNRGANYGKYNYGKGDDDKYTSNGDDYDCYDKADYTNVNQCMKFMAKTTMKTATFRDLSLAYAQGTLVDNAPLQGYRRYRNSWLENWYSSVIAFLQYVMFLSSLTFCILGTRTFLRRRRDHNFAPNWSLKQPLVFA